MDRRSPFVVGMEGAAGVVVTLALVEVVITARSVLVLIGLALFIAVGLQPVVTWLQRHRLPRPAAVTVVCVGVLGVVGGFLSVAIPALVTQVGTLVEQAPSYLRALNDHASFVGRLNDRFHIVQALQSSVTTGGTELVGGVLGAGVVVLSAVASALVVVVLLVYFLSALPRLRAGMHRLVPRTRRPRVIALSDEIAARVGSYVLGTVIVAVIAGTISFIWLLAFGVPYALLLAVLVALLDFIPVIGSTLAGVAASLVAFTVSWPVGVATIAFFVAYRFIEDYLLVPRITGKAVQVSALSTVVALLFGGVLFGVVGALVAIPAAAAVQLIVREVAIPALDRG
jgi:predicted PurR-regulated permease PerM